MLRLRRSLSIQSGETLSPSSPEQPGGTSGILASPTSSTISSMTLTQTPPQTPRPAAEVAQTVENQIDFLLQNFSGLLDGNHPLPPSHHQTHLTSTPVHAAALRVLSRPVSTTSSPMSVLSFQQDSHGDSSSRLADHPTPLEEPLPRSSGTFPSQSTERSLLGPGGPSVRSPIVSMLSMVSRPRGHRPLPFPSSSGTIQQPRSRLHQHELDFLLNSGD